MKSYRKELWFEVPGRRAFLNITPQVEDALRESGVIEGLLLVNAMHITAAVFINEDERGLHHDYEVWLEKLAPHEPVASYHHNRTGEDNAERAYEASGDGSRSRRCNFQWQARLRTVGTDFLWRVRRRTPQTSTYCHIGLSPRRLSALSQTRMDCCAMGRGRSKGLSCPRILRS